MRLAQDGARHLPSSLFLPALVDVEPDGQPDPAAGQGVAGGDDHGNQADEDGVNVLATEITRAVDEPMADEQVIATLTAV